jgi:CheY-like chemotaxis protein
VLIDIAMPGLNGVETVRRARAMVPDLRVLYVTGYADLSGKEGLTGSDPVIKKPFRLAQLAAEVRTAMRPANLSAGGNVVCLPGRG